MSKLLQERWIKLAFGSSFVNESNDEVDAATGSALYPAGAKDYQKAWIDWQRSLPGSMPEQTAAGEDIMPGGESGGYG